MKSILLRGKENRHTVILIFYKNFPIPPQKNNGIYVHFVNVFS